MNSYSRILQDLTERQFAEFDRKRRKRFERITTREAMAAHVAACRRTLKQLYHLPKKTTPLNTRVTGEIKHPDYRIEKLVFESRPGFLVTANLYVPKGKGPFPCVLGACGHSNEGKAAQPYQSFGAGFALKGFMTLIFDPIGQGERRQYLQYKDVMPGCVEEHITMGNQQYLFDDFFGSWRAWDGVRALDALLERPEADPSRVGMTGNSGGGTMTTAVAAVEDRLTMIAPSCYVTTFRHNLENELPADTEQCLPGIIAAGYEEYDHLTAAAPRPVLLSTAEDDFFDQRGSQEAFRHLKQVYTLFGRPDDVAIVTGPGGHGFSKTLREAVYGFFSKPKTSALFTQKSLKCSK
ncbi:MAG: acetylxylan esterase [Planctomycetota bacterium]